MRKLDTAAVQTDSRKRYLVTRYFLFTAHTTRKRWPFFFIFAKMQVWRQRALLTVGVPEIGQFRKVNRACCCRELSRVMRWTVKVATLALIESESATSTGKSAGRKYNGITFAADVFHLWRTKRSCAMVSSNRSSHYQHPRRYGCVSTCQFKQIVVFLLLNVAIKCLFSSNKANE